MDSLAPSRGISAVISWASGLCPDVASEGHATYPDYGDESDDDRFFAPWAEAMVRAEVSRGMLDGMWERIKVRLEDLRKVDDLLVSVFGAGARMVER